MASTSNRKSNSSASSQKPTFRRSYGATSPRTKHISSQVPAPAPRPRKPAARTYVASANRGVSGRVPVGRTPRSGAQRKVAPAQPIRQRQAGTAGASRPVSPTSIQRAPKGAIAPLSRQQKGLSAPGRRQASPARPIQPAVQPRKVASGAPAATRRPVAQKAPVLGAKAPKQPKRKRALKPAKPSKQVKATVTKTGQNNAGGARAFWPLAKAPSDRHFAIPNPLKSRLGSKAPVTHASAPAEAQKPAKASTLSPLRVVVAVLIALVLVVGLGAAVAVNSGFFSVESVVVNGSEHVPQQTAELLVDVPEGATLFNVDEEEIASSLLQNPWVSGVKIDREFPHTLVITPQEREIAAIAYIAADDVAWAIGTDSRWIAPVSLSVTVDASGNVVSENTLGTADAGAADGSDTADGVDAADGTDTSQAADGSADASSTDASGDADASGTQASQDGTTVLTGLDAAQALAHNAGAVLLTDVGTDVTPAGGQEVTSEVVLAGLAYATGFSDSFISQIKDISIASVEAISADLVNGVEVSLGSPDDIQQKEQVVTRLLEQQSGVTYINVRTPDAYSFRSAPVG